MSRIGKKPILIPEGVEVHLDNGVVVANGPKGTLSQAVNPDLKVSIESGLITVERPTDDRRHRAVHGLTRTLIANMVTGVTQGFEKVLALEGVGYRVQKSDDGITLQVGYSHYVEVKPLPGVALDVEGNNRIHVVGTDKQRVGEMAARIRRVRPPDAYKGKGIRYLGEKVRLKPGKSAGRS